MGRFADLDIAISERIDRTEETPEQAMAAVMVEIGLSCDRFLTPPDPRGSAHRRQRVGLAMPKFLRSPKPC